ncbi:MAG: acetylxylan esterase, partial [Vicinamibacterales bacterium]
MKRGLIVGAALFSVGLTLTAQQPPPAQPAPPAAGQTTQGSGRSTNLGSDPNGNPLRLALKTGHVSNYDESKVKAYTLPDPLVLSDGAAVRDARTWQARRRPEILRMYETEIYGRVPARAPTVTWQVAETDPKGREGTSIRKQIVGTFGAEAPRINVTLQTPANAKGPVPV